MTHRLNRTGGGVTRTRTRVAGLAVMGGCVPLLLTACFALPGPEPSSAPTPVASMAQPIPSGDGVLTIGALLPLSGTAAGRGAASLAGVELAVRDIDEAGGVRHASIIVLHGDTGDGADSRAADAVGAFAGRAVDAIVGPNVPDLAGAVGAVAAASGIPVLSAVAAPVEVDGAFAARLRSSDPSLSDVRYGAESYDAAVMIALAAQMAGDDGPASIAEFLPAVTAGDVECSSYGQCLDVLELRADIRYTGVTGQLTTDAGAATAGTLRMAGLRH